MPFDLLQTQLKTRHLEPWESCTTPATTTGYTTTTTTGSSGTGNGGPLAGITFCGPASSICTASTSGSETAYLTSYNTNPGLQSFSANLSSGTVAAAPAAGTLSTYGGTSSGINGGYFSATDGQGYIWTASGQQLVKVNATAGTGLRFRSCLNTTTCSATANTILNNNAVSLAIDSTGSIWVTNPGGASIAEIIGVAAPSWPLLSLARYGQQP